MPDDRPTVVYAGGALEASLAVSILQEAGILARIRNDIIGTLEGEFGTGYNPAIGPVEVLVRAADAEAARLLLEKLSQR